MTLPAVLREPNSRILRMANELVAACDDYSAHELDLEITIQCYKPDEPQPSQKEDVFTGIFYEFLRDEKIATVLVRYTPEYPANLPKNSFINVTELTCQVLDYKKLIKLRDELRRIIDATPTISVSLSHNALIINQVPVPIRADSVKFGLCRLILTSKDPYKTRSWDELVEELGDNPDDTSWKKRINKAYRDTNTQVASIAHTDQLFTLTMSTVALNRKYKVT